MEQYKKSSGGCINGVEGEWLAVNIGRRLCHGFSPRPLLGPFCLRLNKGYLRYAMNESSNQTKKNCCHYISRELRRIPRCSRSQLLLLP